MLWSYDICIARRLASIPTPTPPPPHAHCHHYHSVCLARFDLFHLFYNCTVPPHLNLSFFVGAVPKRWCRCCSLFVGSFFSLRLSLLAAVVLCVCVSLCVRVCVCRVCVCVVLFASLTSCALGTLCAFGAAPHILRLSVAPSVQSPRALLLLLLLRPPSSTTRTLLRQSISSASSLLFSFIWLSFFCSRRSFAASFCLFPLCVGLCVLFWLCVFAAFWFCLSFFLWLHQPSL